MKLLRVGDKGFEKPAVLDDQGVLRDLSGMVKDIAGEALLPDFIERLQKLDLSTLPILPAEKLRVGVPIGHVGKIVCIGLNYSAHADEVKLDTHAEPSTFGKWTSSITGPYDDIIIPRGSVKTDWETELAVVIGKPGAYIAEEDVFDHIVGYCLINDISERDFQLNRGPTWAKGKGCDTFAPIGPWLVTKDEIADPQQLHIWFELDGQRYQDDSTAKMINKIRFLISYVSQFMSLHSGDIIATGTPVGTGAGQKPPVFLRAGNKIRFGIEGLGQQEHSVVDAIK
ncbi:MAG: fumarylacetoacetate hydrolase family protein [Saezia sp.]